jgi:hypothetical protein
MISMKIKLWWMYHAFFTFDYECFFGQIVVEPVADL